MKVTWWAYAMLCPIFNSLFNCRTKWDINETSCSNFCNSKFCKPKWDKRLTLGVTLVNSSKKRGKRKNLIITQILLCGNCLSIKSPKYNSSLSLKQLHIVLFSEEFENNVFIFFVDIKSTFLFITLFCVYSSSITLLLLLLFN